MNINFVTRKLKLSKEDRVKAVERLTRICERFQNQVRSVNVRLQDINGPRGGVDKHCLINVTLADGKIITSNSYDANIGGAIGKCLAVVKGKMQKTYGQRKAQLVPISID